MCSCYRYYNKNNNNRLFYSANCTEPSVSQVRLAFDNFFTYISMLHNEILHSSHENVAKSNSKFLGSKRFVWQRVPYYEDFLFYSINNAVIVWRLNKNKKESVLQLFVINFRYNLTIILLHNKIKYYITLHHNNIILFDVHLLSTNNNSVNAYLRVTKHWVFSIY